MSNDPNKGFHGSYTDSKRKRVNMTPEDAEKLWHLIEKETSDRAEKLPDEQTDLRAMYKFYEYAAKAYGALLSLSVLKRPSEQLAVANWMIAHSYATGHGDTVEDLLAELEVQAMERALSQPDTEAGKG